MDEVPRVAVPELVERYEVFWLDAYGVLVETSGALPGAVRFLDELRRAGRRVLVLTNDASRLPETIVERLGRFGLGVTREEVLTSGDLVAPHLREHDLVGKPCIVLGTADSHEVVRRAGGLPVAFDDPAAEVIVAADDDGFPFLAGVEATLTTLMRRLDTGQKTHLLLPNPDLIYPKGGGSYGLTSGSVALLIEHALRVRFGDTAPVFHALGKPNRPMFEAASVRTGSPDRPTVVMVGDQLATDILGANRFGVDSALVGTGLTAPGVRLDADRTPRWFLPALE